MGEARRRGTKSDRVKGAIQRNKARLLEVLGERDIEMDARLRSGIAPFIERLGPEEWASRRSNLLAVLNSYPKGVDLATTASVRVQEDEIAWYLFLCEQALDDPLCMDVNQVARAAPFLAGIGDKWCYANNVVGLDKKIDEVLRKYKKEPDGALFEILVALAYAEAGWDVELLDEQPQAKTPDMRVTKDGLELFIECKRLSRRVGYAEKERNDFLKLWDAAKNVLMQKRQWLWFKGDFHVDVASLPEAFLADIFASALPINAGESLIYDGPEATIWARLIDQHAVQEHLAEYRVKTNSPMLNKLLGGDWAPLNSSTTIIKIAKISHVVGCEASVLGGYVDEIDWACGFTRDFDSEVSLDKKAKDITKHLSEAIKQVPSDKPSVIHIAAETLEGKQVERIRTSKVMAKIPDFIVDKPVLGVRFHRFQANQTINDLWEFDETVERFERDGLPLDDLIPLNVVVPKSTEMRSGSHWELYP